MKTGLWRLLRTIQWTALAIAAVLGALMIIDQVQLSLSPPLDNPSLVAVQKALAAEPNALELQEAYSLLHYQARKAYFGLSSRVDAGRYAIALALGLFFILWQVRRLKPQAPSAIPPAAKPYKAEKGNGALLISALTIAAIGLGLSFVGGFLNASPNNASSFSIEDERQGHWNTFRGSAGTDQSLAAPQGLVREWDGASMRNVRWKVTAGKAGFSSPVLWGKQIFLSGGDQASFEGRCFDAETGQLLWNTTLFEPSATSTLPKVSDDTGYAAASPAADQYGFYAIFATGGLYALDFKGTIRWSVDLGLPKNMFGHASSLITYNGLLFVQYDQSASAVLSAYDCRSGALVWTVDRSDDLSSSWSSPILVPSPKGVMLVVNGNPFLIAYQASNGQELWRQECLGGEVAPSSTYYGERIFVANQYVSLYALERDTGKIIWEDPDAPLPDVSSPVAAGDYLFLADSNGQSALYDAASAKQLWELERPMGCYASPLYLDGLLYIFDRSGHGLVIHPAAEGVHIIAENELGQAVNASPARYGKSLIVRGVSDLFCLEERP